MNQELSPLESIQEIKSYMQKSTRFLSLSGWSGIWVGSCGIISGLFAMYLINDSDINPLNYHYYGAGYQTESFYSLKEVLRFKLLLVEIITFVVALAGGFFFSVKKARKDGVIFLNHVFRRMAINFSIPLVTGGFVCLAFMRYNMLIFIAPTTLVFYGISLLMIARDTLDEVKKLAIFEILLGILSFYFLRYNMIIWIFGFGVLHIVYGIIMRNKYDRK